MTEQPSGEVWKDIPGFEGRYQVSNLGNVRNTAKNCAVKCSQLKHGYMKVELRLNKTVAQKLVHRLVAEAFIPNPENKPEVNHIHGNKQDNRASQLEWCTVSENLKHSFALGFHKARIGKENELSRKVIQLTKIGTIVKVWDSIMDVQRQLKINNANVSNVALGKSNRKTAGGFVWKFV